MEFILYLLSNISTDIAAIMLIWQAGFPPHLREALLDKVSKGKLVLGGGKSNNNNSSLNHVGSDDEEGGGRGCSSSITKGTSLTGSIMNGNNIKPNTNSSENCLAVSKDTQILLFIGSVLRVYWSCSPPPVWDSSDYILATLGILEVIIGPWIWFFAVIRVLLGEWLLKEKVGVSAGLVGVVDSFRPPLFLRWYILVLISFIIGAIGNFVANPIHKPDMMWPYACGITCTTMAMEGLAIIPQMALSAAIRNIDITGGKNGSATSKFIALLSFGRVCRLFFWIGVALHTEIATGSIIKAIKNLFLFWPLILPDMCHTFLMMDYLVLLIGRGHVLTDTKRPRTWAENEKVLLQSMGSAI